MNNNYSIFELYFKDMITTLGETTGYPGLLWMKKKMEADTVGRLILQFVQLISLILGRVLVSTVSIFTP